MFKISFLVSFYPYIKLHNLNFSMHIVIIQIFQYIFRKIYYSEDFLQNNHLGDVIKKNGVPLNLYYQGSFEFKFITFRNMNTDLDFDQIYNKNFEKKLSLWPRKTMLVQTSFPPTKNKSDRSCLLITMYKKCGLVRIVFACF